VKEFQGELLEIWNFMDYKDRVHSVSFNKNIIHPLLTNGWREMKQIFNFHINHVIDFLYYGNGLFGMIATRPLECFCQIPIYHSRFLKFGYTIDFCLSLTDDIMNQPFLVRFLFFVDVCLLLLPA
jgi:hypothetical protein